MRTTLTIAADVLRELKALARETGVWSPRAANDALRAGLDRRGGSSRWRRRYREEVADKSRAPADMLARRGASGLTEVIAFPSVVCLRSPSCQSRMSSTRQMGAHRASPMRMSACSTNGSSSILSSYRLRSVAMRPNRRGSRPRASL